MARLRAIAEQLKGTAEEGVGWLVVWKTGKNWNGTAVWPDYIEQSCFKGGKNERREEKSDQGNQ